MARRFVLVFFMCLVAATFGCSPLRLRHNERAASVAVVQRFLGNRLCTKELANPDTSPDTAVQRRFEKLLVEAGIMHRTVTGGSIGYVIPAESHYTTRVTRHRSRKFGEILEVCFGTMEVSKVEIIGESRFGTNERVTIVPHVLPWATPFRRRLQLPEMPFQVDVIVADQTVSMKMVSAGFNWRKIFWPIGGKFGIRARIQLLFKAQAIAQSVYRKRTRLHSSNAFLHGRRNVVKQLGLIVAGLVLIVLLNILLLLARPHTVRTDRISGTKTTVVLP